VTARPAWPSYLHGFHLEHAGITQTILDACQGDPYGWLTDTVGTDPGCVLDLACGSAPLSSRLPASGYVGVDCSAGELTLAAVRRAGRLVRADAARLPLGEDSMDVVVCSMALQILDPLEAVLAEAARVLRPGGALVALLPASSPLQPGDRVRYARLLWALRRWGLDYPNVINAQVLARAGWQVSSDDTRRFAYPIRSAQDGHRLVDSLYLPGIPARRLQRARALVAGWVGVELGVPLRRIVAQRG